MRLKKIIVTGIGLLVLTSVLNAQQRGRFQEDDGPGPERLMHKLLDLTEEQESKMQELRLEHQRAVLPLKNQLQTLRGDLKLAMTAEKFDAGKAEKIVGQMEKLRSEIQMKRITHKQEVRQILTPEQREKFDLHLLSTEGRGRHSGHGFGPRGGGRHHFRGCAPGGQW